MKINLTGIQETLLMPLWGRAKLSRNDNPVLKDLKAIEIIDDIIEYNFNEIDQHLSEYSNIGWLVRAKMFDDIIRKYILKHPKATIINLGAGLDTTFFRVDNGLINWYDLDLPDVIDIRKKIIPESNRMKYIAKSLLNMDWIKDIKDFKNGILLFSGGVLFYFEELEVKKLISKLADSFLEGEIIFDTISLSRISYVNRIMKKAGFSNASIKWGIKDNKSISNLSPRIKILEDYPLFARIDNRNFWGDQIAKLMEDNDKNQASCIFHLKFLA